MTRTGLSCLLLCVSACADLSSATTPLPEGDMATFSAEVQPILAARCGDPTCHGRSDRPLEVFSPLRHRMDPSRLFLQEPLDELELIANVRNALAFALDDSPDGNLMLTKPLPVDRGGAFHVGGTVWTTTDDREFRALQRWFEATVPGGRE